MLHMIIYQGRRRESWPETKVKNQASLHALQKPRRRHLPALQRGQLDDSGHPGPCQTRSPGKSLVVHILTVISWRMGNATIPEERGGKGEMNPVSK